MKKKIFIFILSVLLLVSFTSCDGVIDFMGKMGQNVMGSDTSKATAAVEKATVSDDSVTTIGENTDDDRIETSDGKTSIIIGGSGSSIKIDVDESVKSILPSIEEDTVNSITSALTNEDSIATLVDSMNENASETVQEAAKGTATVMKDALDKVVSSIGGADAVEDSAISDALSGLTSALETISTDSSTVTKADVVTLQLIEKFANDAASYVTEDADGNMSFDTSKDLGDLISSANTLASVTSALSNASKFELDLGSVISSVMGMMGGSEEGSGDVSTYSRFARSMSADEVDDVIAENIESIDISDYAPVIRSVYKALKPVLGNAESFKSNAQSLALHKSTYETYVNLVAQNKSENDQDFKAFKTFDSLLKYAAAAVISEAERYYTDLKADPVNLGLPADIKLPASLGEIISDFEEANPWLNDRSTSDIHVTIPDKYNEIVAQFINAVEGSEGKPAAVSYLETYIKDQDKNAQTVTAINTVRNMAKMIGVENISKLIGQDFDIDQVFDDVLRDTFGVVVNK